MIKAVILDLDDTLYAYEPLDAEARARVRNYACEQLGITNERYDEAYLFGRNETKRQLGDVGASHNRMLYYQKTLEYLGLSPMPISLRMYETYWGTFLEKMTLFDGVREFIDCLHEHKIKVMICTDLTAHIQHRKIEALGLAKDICCLVTSEEEVCCIGDSLVKDVEGAKAAGMRAILFHPEEPSAQQYEAVAQFILQS